MPPFYLVSFCVALLLAASSHAERPPISVKFSTNVAEPEVGKPFIATCDIANFFYSHYGFGFDFMFNNDLLATFYRNSSTSASPLDIKFLNALAPNFGITEHSKSFHYNDDKHYYISGSCSIELTLRTHHSGSFWCQVHGTSGQPGHADLSNKWIPVGKDGHKNAALAFSTNVTKLESGKPFTAKCVVSNFDAGHKNYVVKFWQTSGLLASYEVKAPTLQHPKAHTMFVENELANVTVHHGVHFDYPTFEVQIVPHSNVSENYWCQLEENDSHKSGVKSNLVPNVPTLVYSSSDGGRLNRCSVTGNFEPEGKEYSIHFMVNSKKLAIYKFKPNQPDEFIVPENGYKIAHGENVTFPVFEILFNTPHSLSGHFWCVLGVGPEGQKSYGEFKSNSLIL